MIIAGPSGTLGSSDFAFFWTGRTPSPESYIKGFYYRLDNDSWNWTQSRGIVYYDIPEGSHRIDVKAVDNRNAEDPSPASRSFSVKGASAAEPNESPFTIQRDYQSQLNSGIISEGLRGQFRDNGRTLSQGAAVLTVTQNSEWLVTDGIRQYKVRKETNRLNIYEEDRIFRLDSEFQDDLDDGDLTADIRQEFQNEGVSLSQSASVSVIAEGVEWLIDGKYTVRMEGNRLNVYGDELQFSIELVEYMVNGLEGRFISDGLRQEFKANGITLLQSAMVTPTLEQNQWFIIDGDKTYIVRGNDSKLDIYESINDRASEAIPLAPGTAIKGLSRSDSDDPGGIDEDWFRVTAEGNQITVLFSRPDSTGSSVIRIYRYPEIGDGREIARFTAQYRAFFATGIVPGDYLIRVTPGADENPDAAYSLTAIVDSLPQGVVWDREKNDRSSDATEIPSVYLSRQTPWVEMVGNKWSNSDNRDYFKVHIDTPQPVRLSLNITVPQSKPVTVVLSPVELASSEIARFEVTPNSGPQWKVDTAVELGDYLLEVVLPEEQDPEFTYVLSLQVSDFPSGEMWELEPNDFPDLANSLPFSVRLRGAKGHAGDTSDWLKLMVPGDGILNLTTSRILSLNAVNIYLFDPVLQVPVGDPLDYDIRTGSQRDYLNLDVAAGEYLVELDLTKIIGSYWITAQFFTSAEHDAPEDTPLFVEDVLTVRVVWKPGGVVAFDLLETTSGKLFNSQPVLMYDDENDGTYVGTYTIPSLEAPTDPLYLMLYVIVHLKDQSGNTADIPLREFDVDLSPPDETPPEIYSVSHNATEPLRVGQELTVTIEGEAENTGTFDIGEMIRGLPVYDDGRHKDGAAGDGVYKGTYTVRAEDYISGVAITGYLADEYGNTASLDSSALVDIVGNRPAIYSVEHNGRLTLGQGDTLTVTLQGDPDGIASFDIEGLARNIPMYDDGQHGDGAKGDGQYVGTYTAAKGDGVISAPVTAHLVDRNGRKTSKTAPIIVNIDAVAPAPVIGVEARDRPNDQGGYITLTWNASSEIDFSHYNIYLSRDPSRITEPSSLVKSDITNPEQVTVDLAVLAYPYFAAVTASDIMGNESSLADGSTAGPVEAFDNLSPAPVRIVEAVDRDQDYGGVIILSWTDVNQDEDFARYNIYQERQPILTIKGLTPVDSVEDRYFTVVDVLVDSDQVDYYFAVTAMDLSGNESELDELGASVSGPVRGQDNIGPEPDTPVKLLAGPVGTVHYNQAAFHLSRYLMPDTGSATIPTEVGTPTTGYYIRLDDANWQWTTNSTVIYHNLETGPHKFSVRPSDSSKILTRSFSVSSVFTSEREPNDSPDTANGIRTGVVIRGEKGQGAGDWFKVHVPIARPGVIDVMLSSRSIGSNTSVSVYKAVPFQKIGQFEGNLGHFAYGVTQVSDYFIHVDSDTEGAQYDLAVTFNKLTPGFFWEVESNDQGSSANEVQTFPTEVGTPYSAQSVEVRGAGHGNQDQDWYKVHIPEMRNDAPVGALYLMSLSLYRPKGEDNPIAGIYSGLPGVKERQVGEFSVDAGFTGVVTPGGDYFIRVDNGNETVSYHFLLSLWEIPALEGTIQEIEPNNLAAHANSLPLGWKMRGTNWDGDEDDDWYKLSIGSDGILNLSFSRPSGVGETTVQLYDVSLANIAVLQVNVNTAQKSSINLYVKSGLYYVSVHPQNENPTSEYQIVALLVESITLRRFSDGKGIEPEGRPLRAGDLVELSLVWTGSRATYDIGNVAKGIALEKEVGREGEAPAEPEEEYVYRGRYTIAEGDNEANAPVKLNLEDAYGNTAEIETGEAVTIDTNPPEIIEISHNAVTPLAAGKELMVQMVGSPRSRARFDISGFRTGLDMYNMTSFEDDPSLVILNWDRRVFYSPAPSSLISHLSSLVITGEVKNLSSSMKDRVKVKAIFYKGAEMVGEVSAFTTPRDISPGLKASFKILTDYTGTEEVRLQLAYGADGNVVGESFDDGVYTGVYHVEDDNTEASIVCYLEDSAGNQSVAKAEGVVTFDTIPPVIQSLTHDASRILVEGDVLTVTLEGEPGGEATYDIMGFRSGLKMAEASSGNYTGAYRVRPGDQVSGALVTGRLKDKAGNESTYIGVQPVSINTSAPVITLLTHTRSPVPLTQGEELIVSVSTDPHATVTFSVNGLVQGRPMYDDGQHDDGESNDGVYKGFYTIRRGDNVRDGKVVVTVVSPNGKSVVRESLEHVSVDTEAPSPVTGVVAMDRPDDEGGYIVLSWAPSNAGDFHNYNIYQSEQPIVSLIGLELVDANTIIAECSLTDVSCTTAQIPCPLAPVPQRSNALFYFAVTAVDDANNESLLTSDSSDGPVLGTDNLPPPPVGKVSGSDRAYDNGKVITIAWTDPSPAEDFYQYQIYMSDRPITESLLSLLSPVDILLDRNILTTDVIVLQDGVDFFFAVTAVDFSGNESRISDNSFAGPLSSIDNLGAPPDTLVKILSGPVGEIHHNNVTFRWTRWFHSNTENVPGYYYKLDNSNWIWTNETEKTYYDLQEGEHAFYVKADLGNDADPVPARRVFIVKRLIISEMEPNDSAERANWISKGFTVAGTIGNREGEAPAESGDWYRFHAESQGLMTLNFHQVSGTGTIEVAIFGSYPPTQESKIGAFITDPITQRNSFGTGVELGDCLILLSSQSSGGMGYEMSVAISEMPENFQWDKENNDLPRSAQLIVKQADQPVEISGFGNKAGDVDWYRLQVSISTPLFLNVDFVRPQASGSTEMSIYASYPVTEDPMIGLITLQPNVDLGRFSAPIGSGDYYFKIDNTQESVSIYSFRISFSPISGRWEMEPNGVSQFANSLPVDTVVNGTSWHPDNDVDWYKLRLDRRGILVLSYFRPFGTGAANIQLKSANRADIADDTASIITGQMATIGASLSLGDYFVVVRPENETDASAGYMLFATMLDYVELSVVDKSDNLVTSESDILGVGDIIELTAKWKAGNTLSFDIGDLRSAIPMNDRANDGIYTGSYEVQSGDDVSDAEIVLSMGIPYSAPTGALWSADLVLEDKITIDTTPPKISRVDHNVRLRPLSEGENLNVIMTGESGASSAFFNIVSDNSPPSSSSLITHHSSLPMPEGPDGTYSGSYTVEERVNLEEGFVVCYLVDSAGNESFKFADMPISFDTTFPEIMRIEHDADRILVEGNILTVTASSDTPGGKAAFSIDGVLTDRLMYDDGTHGDIKAEDGAYTGQYTVRKGDNVNDASIQVTLEDKAGNVSTASAFKPISIDTNPPEIISLVHDASEVLSEEKVLTVTLEGEPGNIAAFDIGEFQPGLPMYDDGTRFDEIPNDGIYVGTYTIKKGDSFKDAQIVGYLTDKNGNRSFQYVFERVNIDAVPPLPVVGVQAIDVPDDQGFWITLSWLPSTDDDFDHYNIYRESSPVTSVRGLTPILDNQLDSSSPASLLLGGDVSVPTNNVDYYIALTAVDVAGNESLLDMEGASGSVAGPVQAVDNLAPDSVTVVSCSDRPDDQGRTALVSWTKMSTEDDFDHYNVYLLDEPIVSIEDLEPLPIKADDLIFVAGARQGAYVSVPSDGMDFYFAVTAVDKNGNESPLDDEGRSVAGPVRTTDDTPPQPVILYSAVDTPGDDGGFINVLWLLREGEAPAEPEVHSYNFYLSTDPISDKDLKFLDSTVVDASRVEILDSVMMYRVPSPADLVNLYVAVTAVDLGGNISSLDESGRSVAGPVQSVPNKIGVSSNTTVYAGFDADTYVFIPADALGAGNTVDILLPDSSILQSVKEADLFLDRAHIDPEIDSFFANTVRNFSSSAANTRQPVTITLSYPDVTEMQIGILPVDLSQQDELQFRIFRLNLISRIPRWELVPGSQSVNTLRNTISVKVREFGVYRVARLKLPENLDRVVVYPNPFIPSQSINGHITFKNLTESFTIQIYDVAGERIRAIEGALGGGDEAIWDVCNNDGEEVASGTYVFMIEGAGDTYMGKIVVLR